MSVAQILPQEIRRITGDEFLRLVESQFFPEDEKLELVDGVLVHMSPQGIAHALAVSQLLRWLSRLVSDKQHLIVQSSVQIGNTSLLEPDLAVIKGLPTDYVSRHPQGSDIELVIEVSDSSLAFDSRRKMPLYAGACVPEYWIVNIPARRLEIHTDPKPNGYGVIHIVDEFHEVAPQIFPHSPIEVVKLLPPKS